MALIDSEYYGIVGYEHVPTGALPGVATPHIHKRAGQSLHALRTPLWLQAAP